MTDFSNVRGPVTVRTRALTLRVWVWDGEASEKLREWLGNRFVEWTYVAGELMLTVDDGKRRMLVKPGYAISQNPEGPLVVSSPDAASMWWDLVGESEE